METKWNEMGEPVLDNTEQAADFSARQAIANGIGHSATVKRYNQ